MSVSPKLYFYDTGLLTHLLGVRTAEELDHYFWQDSSAHEVDLLMRKGQGFSIFEIKATQTISTNLFKEMDRFEEIATPTPVNKTLIYGGAENEKRTKYNVISWKNVSGF